MFKLIYGYLFQNSNRNKYSVIALKHRTSLWHVYRIAHDKPIHSLRDGCIYRELHRQGVIS
jgi:hypothetical protein